MKTKFNIIFTLALFICCQAFAASAATITVVNNANTGAGSLRAAIASSVNGDTIDFNLSGCPCTIILASELIIQNRSIIISGPGSSQLTVSGNGVSRVFHIQGQASPAVTISGLTITNGVTTANGGGVYLQDGTLTLANSVVTNNSAPALAGSTGYGGGIMVDAITTLNVINSTISNNTSSRLGGGISTNLINQPSDVTLSGSTLSDNTAGFAGAVFISDQATLTTLATNFTNNTSVGTNAGGGAIVNMGRATLRGGNITLNDATGNNGDGGAINNQDTMALTNVNVSNNTVTSSGDGGGIWNSGTLTLTNSTVAGNQGSANGGGILNTGTLDLTASTISGNTALASGGGINNTGTLNMVNSTISGNQISSGVSAGGGILNGPFGTATATAVNCTIAFNTAGRGGGILHSGGAFSLRNTILAKNTSTDRGPDGFDGNGTVVSQGFNLIGNNRDMPVFSNGANNDIVGTNAAPVNPLLATLASNGGQTQTHALLAGSPAVDKSGAAFGVVTDQRGNSRFVVSAVGRPGGNNSDIGSFEFAAPTAAAVEINGRVLTVGNRGLRNATVLLFNDRGEMQTVNTGSFGYYRFPDVEIGRTYVLFVRSKSYTFTPLVINVTDEISGLDVVAQQ